MSPIQAATREYELTKYLQLVSVVSSEDQSHRGNAAPFLYMIPKASALNNALTTLVELLQLRLSAQGAFVVLIDDDRPYFLAGTPKPESNEDDGSPAGNTSWLGNDVADSQQWLRIFQQTNSVTTSSTSSEDRVFKLPSLKKDDRSSKLSSVRHDRHLTFYAGTSLISKEGVAIGVVFIVDSFARSGLAAEHEEFLLVTAKRCMQLLESAQESAVQGRWEKMNEQLTRFVRSRAIRSQQLEEPTSLGRTHQQQRRKETVEDMQTLALRHSHDPSKAADIKFPENDYGMGAESKRLLDVEIETDERIAKEDQSRQDIDFTAQNGNDRKRGNSPGETTYQKVFRRAAECLLEALQADGVLFTNGITGHHGIIQPIAEAEDELKYEIVQRPNRESFPEEPIVDGPMSLEDEYRRGLRLERPSEIIGMSTRETSWIPETKRLNRTAIGLARLNEGHLQQLMDRHPNGSVWYFHWPTSTGYQLRNDTLAKADSREQTKNLMSTFRDVRQMIFAPLTDPVSLKRLAGCLVWSTQEFPLFSDTTELPSLRGFLHILESEISRIDALAAVKQKEAFVSSVSHELRTPLHGILGSVQLLADTTLDSFQSGLAETIKLSGSTLNETLTSVLSYARINQFERQQHKYRQRRPPDEEWSLPNKAHLPSGPDVDFKGLYSCTNIALLCEEIAGVLEAGQSYDNSTDQRGVTVLVEIEYHENWNFFTEPGALRRIALNIIGNALKYTEKGSVTIKLAASKIAPDEIRIGGDNASRRMITLSVKDTGKGISKDFMDNHLFVPFTQEDTNSSHGVGLGMSIVKSLVSLLAGEIKVHSKLDEGTEVTVMMPMRLYDSERSENERPALELEQCTASLREQRLSVILFGFSTLIRRALEKYLCDWFHCNVLESTDDAEPDVVLVEECNDEIASDVDRTSQHYGLRGVLLSIGMVTGALAKPMRPIKGYTKWERIPRPIGPNKLGKALSACIVKLREIRENGSRGQQDDIDHEPENPLKADQQSRNDNANDEKDARTALQERKQTDIVLPDRTKSQDTLSPEPRSQNVNADAPNLVILVVEDNAINRKLLCAFLKKHGCRDVQFAENGALAIEAVQGRSDGFNVIFMDLSMPVMDGFTATREVRRIERERSSFAQSPSDYRISPAYIVALTGLASDRDEDEALAAGVDVFVTKPVQFRRLSKLLKEREEKMLPDGKR